MLRTQVNPGSVVLLHYTYLQHRRPARRPRPPGAATEDGKRSAAQGDRRHRAAGCRNCQTLPHPNRHPTCSSPTFQPESAVHRRSSSPTIPTWTATHCIRLSHAVMSRCSRPGLYGVDRAPAHPLRPRKLAGNFVARSATAHFRYGRSENAVRPMRVWRCQGACRAA